MKLSTQEAIEALVRSETVRTQDVDKGTLDELASSQILDRSGILALPECQMLDQATIKEGLTTETKEWLKSLDVLACTASTNSDLLNRAVKHSIDGEILVAEVQLAGRGRRGRTWVSPFGQNIMVSIGANVDQSPTSIGSVSLAIGIALAQALESLGLNNVQLKWPNDVLIEGEKVAGILVEMASPRQPVILVIGIGINVHAAPGVEVTGDYRATRIVEHLSELDRTELLIRVVDQVTEVVGTFSRDGFSFFKQNWQSRDYLFGESVQVTEIDHELSGIARGIDDSGAYQVETSRGLERVIAGTVRLL